jgi:hypothetical protein
MRISAFVLVAGLSAGVAGAEPTVLYSQNFETPTGFVNDGGDVNIYRNVNQLYGNQPVGFTFAQTNTVETLLVGGTQAWNTGFLDPQGVAGKHVLGLLATFQNDYLGLAFNVGDYDYLNFRLDISSIDLDRWSGPFVPAGGTAPTFRISLFDNPLGANGVGSGSALSFAEVSGISNPLKNTFDWTNVVVGLSTAGNTNGNVIVRIDLLTGGYAAMDNFVIAASNTAGEVPAIPEPGTYAMMMLGAGVLALRTGWESRRKRPA